MKKISILWLVILLAVCVVALIPAMPSVSLPREDSGIFLYFGQQILAGKLPYVDLFDHKPPLVFYLNALGLALGGAWGVWALQLLGIYASALMGYSFLSRPYGAKVAGYAILAFLLNLVLVMERGNLTEVYALPFQFAALALFAGLDAQSGFRWRGFLIGICAGMAFMLRQNLIGLWIALAMILIIQSIFQRTWRGFVELLRWGLGAIVVVGGWVIYFALRGAITEFWDVAFVYNFVYSSVSNVERLASLGYVFEFLTTSSGFFAIASLAWLACLAVILVNHEKIRSVLTHRWVGLPLALVGLYLGLRALIVAEAGISLWRASQLIFGSVLIALGVFFFLRWPEQHVRPWLARQKTGEVTPFLPLFIAALDFPIEVLLVSLSATNFAHYFMAFLPVITLLIGFFAFSVVSWSQSSGSKLISSVWLVLFFVLLTQNGITALLDQGKPHVDEQLSQTVKYIQDNSRPNDKILVWGFNTGLYYLSNRQSPSRLMMQGPLFRAGYTDARKVQDFLNELKANPPALIIDTRLYPFVTQDAGGRCAAPTEKLPKGMDGVFSWICSKYQLAASFGRDHWLIYRMAK